MDYSDFHRDIIEQCKRGHRKAQFELYQLYSGAMYNVCLRMVKNEHDAEDLLQNSFVDVFGHLESFKFQSSIGAWIKRIVINNCINFLKRRRLQFDELEDRHSHVTETLHEDSTDPVWTVDAIQRAMMQLPDGYRVVFSLYLLEGYDHQEIGEILNISEATSKSQYSRAKKKLRDILSAPAGIY